MSTTASGPSKPLVMSEMSLLNPPSGLRRLGDPDHQEVVALAGFLGDRFGPFGFF